ncbi:uncharacterized protein FIBRA_08129 [Fibroporia radiculosa]|uniref:Cyclin N-terminal domain-containing protein n=1 Tax=Fibroporia radiculosa TaxID=599839 RepID=J4IC69_9APHY|nr:uncharacterized protein FIBRA_08129 [Fibroporia radiculosa]CCM05891.1 predicted protein [Fibroporia radiculosa]
MAKVAARFLEETFDCSGHLPPLPSNPDPRMEPPGWELDIFIGYVLYRTHLAKWTVINALYLLDILKKRFEKGRVFCGHYLILTALILSMKMLADDVYALHSWVAAAGNRFHGREIARLEREVLRLLDYNLPTNISVKTLDEFERKLMHTFGARAPPKLNATRKPSGKPPAVPPKDDAPYVISAQNYQTPPITPIDGNEEPNVVPPPPHSFGAPRVQFEPRHYRSPVSSPAESEDEDYRPPVPPKPYPRHEASRANTYLSPVSPPRPSRSITRRPSTPHVPRPRAPSVPSAPSIPRGPVGPISTASEAAARHAHAMISAQSRQPTHPGLPRPAATQRPKAVSTASAAAAHAIPPVYPFPQPKSQTYPYPIINAPLYQPAQNVTATSTRTTLQPTSRRRATAATPGADSGFMLFRR